MRTDESYLALPEHIRAQLDHQGRQEDFAGLVGISQQAVSRLIHKGALEPGDSMGEWLLAYCERLQDQAAGRGTEDDTLPRERALLARAQRRGQDIRNQREMADYAPRAILEDVLAFVAAGMAQRLAELPAQVFAECPTLPEPARRAVEAAVGSARAEWLRATASLPAKDADGDPTADETPELLDSDDESTTAP